MLLTGEVPTEADKAAVEQAVQRVDNVRTIVNEIGVMPTSARSASRSTDSLLSGKVKASLVEAKDLMAQSFKVVTERRTVYLMGIVTEREAARAADIAQPRQRRAQGGARVRASSASAELAIWYPSSRNNGRMARAVFIKQPPRDPAPRLRLCALQAALGGLRGAPGRVHSVA